MCLTLFGFGWLRDTSSTSSLLSKLGFRKSFVNVLLQLSLCVEREIPYSFHYSWLWLLCSSFWIKIQNLTKNKFQNLVQVAPIGLLSLEFPKRLCVWLVAWWRPSFVKLAEKLWISEGPSIYNDLQQIDQCHHQTGDQEKWHEWTEMSPGYSQNVAQTAFIAVMSGASGGWQRQIRYRTVLRWGWRDGGGSQSIHVKKNYGNFQCDASNQQSVKTKRKKIPKLVSAWRNYTEV